jgi:hypothetical protein
MSDPLFHVKRGHPTPEELAALTAVVAAKTRAATAARSRHSTGPPAWGSPAAAHRQPLPPPGPGAWKRAVREGVGPAGGVGMGHAGGVAVGHAGGGLWTTEDPPSAVGLPSRIGGPGNRGSGSRAPAGPTATLGPIPTAGPTATAGTAPIAGPTLTAGGADA